jgi:hypothetical protein
MTKNYRLRFKCSEGDADVVLLLWNREETFEQIQNTAWHFECPVHGVQKEIPFETKEIATSLSPEGLARKSMTSAKIYKARRRSKRLHLRIPVAVYGQNRAIGAFREETETNLVNANGGLVMLAARVRMGETFLVVNKATQEEQQCRVVYVAPLEGPKKKVGFELLRSAPNFWRVDFPPIN